MPVKQKIGIVISNKMQKTIVVKIEDRYSHPMYSKTLIKTKKYLAHDELEECNIGDELANNVILVPLLVVCHNG